MSKDAHDILDHARRRHATLSALWERGIASLRENGLIYEHPRGRRVNPELLAVGRLGAELIRLESSILKVLEQQEGDPDEDADDPILDLVDPAVAAAARRKGRTSSERRAVGQRQNR